LGSGKFGNVFKCQNKLDGIEYAIKCTKNSFESEEDKILSLKEVIFKLKKKIKKLFFN